MLNLFKEKYNKSLFNVPLKQNDTNSKRSTLAKKTEKIDLFEDKDLSTKGFLSKYYIPENKQWINSVYTYNKAINKSLPIAKNVVDNLLKTFFNLTSEEDNEGIDNTQSKNKSYDINWKRDQLSINKMWISKSEIKHSNDKVIITIYIFNKKRNIYVYKLKNLYKELTLHRFKLKSKSLSFSRFGKPRGLKKLLYYAKTLASKPFSSSITRKKQGFSKKKVVRTNLYNVIKKISNKNVKGYGQRFKTDIRKLNVYLKINTLKNKKILNRNVSLLNRNSMLKNKQLSYSNINIYNKFRKFIFINKPVNTGNNNNIYNKTRNLNKFYLSNFSAMARKTMIRNNVMVMNSKKKAFYSLFYKYYLNVLLNNTNNLNNEKKSFQNDLLPQSAYLNNVNLAKNGNVLHNANKTSIIYHLIKKNLLANNVTYKNKVNQSNLLSKLHFLFKQSKIHSSLTIKKSEVNSNIKKRRNYTKNVSRKRNNKNLYYNLIKLYKQLYTRNEYKNTSSIKNIFIREGLHLLSVEKKAENLLYCYLSKIKQKIFSRRKLFAFGRKGAYKSNAKIRRLHFKRAGKKLKNNIYSSVNNIKNIITIFNSKKTAFINLNSLSSNLTAFFFDGKKNEKGITMNQEENNGFINSILNTYIKNVYQKEILLLSLLKDISFYSYITKNFFLLSLKNIISKIYKKKIQLNIVNLKYIYLNSDIFSQSISKKMRNRRNKLLRILGKSLSIVKMPGRRSIYNKEIRNVYDRNFIKKYKYLNKYIYDIYTNNNINSSVKKSNNSSLSYKNSSTANRLNIYDSLNQWIYNSFYKKSRAEQWIVSSTIKNDKRQLYSSNNGYKLNSYKLSTVEKAIINSIKYKSIFGVRLEAAGRLTKRFTASRSVFKFKYKGSLKNTNSLNNPSYSPLIIGINKPNIQFTKITSKTRNGSFGLKGWVSGH